MTWGEEFFNTWKQRLESSNMSDKKSWKLQSYLTVCSISCNQSFCFVVHAWRQRTSVSVIVSKKLMKFLPVSVQPVQQSGCPDHWRLQKMYLNLFFFFIVRLLTPQPGKALSYQMKVRFVRELGKAKWPSWISHSPGSVFLAVYPFLIFWFSSRLLPCFKYIMIAKVLSWWIISCRSRMSFVDMYHNLK